MNEVRSDNDKQPRTTRHYWLLTTFCLGIVMAVGWAFRLEQTALCHHLSLVETTDRLQVEILTAHLRFEESFGGEHSTVQPNAEELAWQHLDEAQKDSTMLIGQCSVDKQIISLTADPDWQRQVSELQKKLAAWRQIIVQMGLTAHGPVLDSQLDSQFHELFLEISHGLSALMSRLHALSNDQMRKIRLTQAALLALGLTLIIFVGKVFRHLIHAQLIGTQESQAQLRRRISEMATLSALGRLANVETNPALFAQNALQEVATLLHPDVASIYLRSNDALSLLAVYHPPDVTQTVLLPDHKIVGGCLCGLAGQGQRIYVDNILADSRCTLHECRDAGIHSFAALPLLAGEKVIGILGLGFLAEQELGDQHLLFESLADHLATGLQNCLLYDLSQQQARKMREQIELLSLGAEVNAALTQNTTFREMLDACCSLLVRHLGAAFARIWVMQDNNRVLELQASAGMYTRIDGSSRLKAVDQSNKIGAIALSRLPYFSNKLLGDPQIVNQEWVKQEKMEAFAGHPLMIGDQVIGVLAMFACQPLSGMVQKMLSSIADSIALAIDNKKAVLLMRQSHERYRDLIENISDWIWAVDIDGVYTYCSRQVSQMLGYEPHKIMGQSTFSLMPKDEAERVLEIFADLTASQQPFIGLEFTMLHKDGHRVILEGSGSPIFNEHDQFTGYRGINRDITAKKAAENAILDQKRMFEAMFNAVPDAMIFTDTEQQAKLTNQGFAKLFGYADHELLGQNICQLYDCLEDFTLQAPPLSLPTEDYKQPPPLEINFKRKNGGVFPGESVSAAIKNSDGELVGYLHLIRDISDRKRAEASQRHTQKMEALGTLSGGIAHDFNNLLNVISGYTVLTIDDLAPESQQAKNLQEVANASERAVALVRQILAFSRGVEEGKKTLFLHHIAKEVARLMAGTLPATIEIKQGIDPKCPAVLADASQIHQVLMNLCTNAYHAMRESGGVLRIDLAAAHVLDGEVADLPAGPYAKLTVADTGHGMEQAVQERIFEPYFTTKRMEEGTGLGLATVHGIIKGHGGHISVTSEVGKGSTFTIYLPIINQPAELAFEKDDTRETADVQLKGTILYVDDVLFNVNLGEQILAKAGCHVTGETDSTAALTLFAAAPERFDLVITDQTMPKLTGIDMAKEMLAIRPDLPIIIVTGHSDTVDEERAKAVGVRELLLKPIQIQQLLSTVGRMLRQTAPEPSAADSQPPNVQHNRRAGDKAKAPASLEAVRNHLCTTYGVDKEQLAPMLHSMQESLRAEGDKARAAISQHDLKALAMAAHTIKGVLLNGGLAVWADLAKAIELSAKAGETKAYGTMLDELAQGIAPLLNKSL